jgi:hypothetical protein
LSFVPCVSSGRGTPSITHAHGEAAIARASSVRETFI